MRRRGKGRELKEMELGIVGENKGIYNRGRENTVRGTSNWEVE